MLETYKRQVNPLQGEDMISVISLGGGLYVKTIRPCIIKYCRKEEAYRFKTPHHARIWAAERFQDFDVVIL